MIKVSQARYFEIQSKFLQIPYSQSKDWYEYLSLGREEILFFVDNEIDPMIMFFGKKIKVPFSTKNILIIDTPLIKSNFTEKTIRKRLLSLLEHDFIGFEIDSISEYDVEYEVGFRRAGFIRPLALSKSPLSIDLNLATSFNYDSNWKRNVKKSKEAGVIVEEILNPTKEDAILFVRLFEDTKKQKKLKYSLDSEAIYRLIRSDNIRMFYAKKDDIVLSAQIFYHYNLHCYSIYRVNSIASRSNNSSYVLYDEIFKKLSSEGFLAYDFGRIPPSNHATDSVYTFKNASRGRKVQYNGEWVFYKNKWIEYLMFLYKQFVLKKQRY
ncbi:GNAT family N-acetyltransferase [Marinifilum sp. D737]|uniref:GNAT family N-acetyltransferase n=1 Tax=Marinifilum sp. D737 TaxID=2969628 RepID=UPI0022728FE4|nr:GNAT family N-acetyltransferase [Marinifilum sp. D737]MCY1635012.1 GNAT family N-acetyltransferase [Marinifilum sp. D737]